MNTCMDGLDAADRDLLRDAALTLGAMMACGRLSRSERVGVLRIPTTAATGCSFRGARSRHPFALWIAFVGTDRF